MTTINDILETIETEENRGTEKSSHTTKPTTCFDVRRSGSACGICGSYNLVEQGVRFCVSCGKEEEDLQQFSNWWNKEERKQICNCPDIYREFNSDYPFKISPRDSYYITKCIDCGAIDSIRFCPNCSVKRPWSSTGTWKHWDGRIKCGSCGFSINDPISCGIGAKKNKAQGKLGTKKAKKSAVLMSNRKMKRLAAKNQPHPNFIRS